MAGSLFWLQNPFGWGKMEITTIEMMVIALELSLSLLRRLCEQGQIKWTLHALKRIRERGISSSEAIACIQFGKIIEEYHDDKPFPSCLICHIGEGPLHVVVSSDGESVYFITAYRPSPEEWESDFTHRKETS